MSSQAETGCCPRFKPAPWDEKEVTWQDKLFIKDHVRSFLHIPLNFGQVVVRNTQKIEEAGAAPPQPLMFTEERSLWRIDLHIAVGKEVPGAEMEKVSGTFLTKVFEGPYKDAGKWARTMQEHVRAKGKRAEKLYFFYTTCPACAKAYGKNYTVVLARV